MHWARASPPLSSAIMGSLIGNKRNYWTTIICNKTWIVVTNLFGLFQMSDFIMFFYRPPEFPIGA